MKLDELTKDIIWHLHESGGSLSAYRLAKLIEPSEPGLEQKIAQRMNTMNHAGWLIKEGGTTFRLNRENVRADRNLLALRSGNGWLCFWSEEVDEQMKRKS